MLAVSLNSGSLLYVSLMIRALLFWGAHSGPSFLETSFCVVGKHGTVDLNQSVLLCMWSNLLLCGQVALLMFENRAVYNSGKMHRRELSK